MPTPHRVVDNVLDGLANGANQVGAVISTALDKPPTELGGPQGIHHIVKRTMDGYVESLKTVGEGLQKGLDQPVEQFSIPPDISPGGIGRFRPTFRR